jgi:hypothetical protein
VPPMRAVSARADVGGIEFRDAEQRSPKNAIREDLTRPMFDLTGGRKLGSEHMGGYTH